MGHTSHPQIRAFVNGTDSTTVAWAPPFLGIGSETTASRWRRAARTRSPMCSNWALRSGCPIPPWSSGSRASCTPTRAADRSRVDDWPEGSDGSTPRPVPARTCTSSVEAIRIPTGGRVNQPFQAARQGRVLLHRAFVPPPGRRIRCSPPGTLPLPPPARRVVNSVRGANFTTGAQQPRSKSEV